MKKTEMNMSQELTKISELFIENKESLKKGFRLEYKELLAVCAAVFTMEGKNADIGKMKQIAQQIKKSTSAFSDFRDLCKLPLAAMFSISKTPEKDLQKTLAAYQIMKKTNKANKMMPISAKLFADRAEGSSFRTLSVKQNSLYSQAKKKHPFHVDKNSSINMTLCALSEKSEEELLSEMERCYSILISSFPSKAAVYTLSQILSLSEGTPEEKCGRVCRLYELLKKKGCKYGTRYELGTLGTFALLPVDLEMFSEKMVQVDQYLQQQKGYGAMSVSAKQRLVHAGLLVSMELCKEDKELLRTEAISGTISLILAEQMAMCCAMAGAAAASAAAGSC